MEQILKIFPREFTSRLRMIPALEETLMRYNESSGDQKGSGAASASSGVSSSASAGEKGWIKGCVLCLSQKKNKKACLIFI